MKTIAPTKVICPNCQTVVAEDFTTIWHDCKRCGESFLCVLEDIREEIVIHKSVRYELVDKNFREMFKHKFQAN